MTVNVIRPDAAIIPRRRTSDRSTVQWRYLCVAACETLIRESTPTDSIELSVHCQGPHAAHRQLLLSEELAREYGLGLRSECSDHHLTVRYSRSGPSGATER
jgi:hypothetical protein